MSKGVLIDKGILHALSGLFLHAFDLALYGFWVVLFRLLASFYERWILGKILVSFGKELEVPIHNTK